MSKERHYSAKELADLKLPGLAGTPQNITARAKREKWPFRNRKGRDSGREYPESALPKETRDFLLEQRTQEAAKSLLATPPAPTEGGETAKAVIPAGMPEGAVLNDKQTAVQLARATVLHALEKLEAGTGCRREKAIDILLQQANEGKLQKDVLAAIEQARDPRGKKGEGLVSKRTLKRWLSQKGAGSLAPRPTHEPVSYLEIVWLPNLLARYRVPSHPTVVEALRQMAADLRAANWAEADIPKIDAVRHVLKKVPVPVLEKGRATGAAWKALLPCVRRDWSGLHSNDVWIGDGHTFKAKVQHPDHGRPFASEVTLIVDTASRYVTGWTVSLSENCIAVAEALGHAMIRAKTKPLIYYSDNGSGQTGKMLDAPITGILARAGVWHETGIPGNPQGRGLIERIWQTITIPLARQFPTCQTATMDRETLNKRTREIASALKKGGTSPTFVPTWRQFIDALDEAVEDYNQNHEHRSLGKRTPAAVYAEKLDPLASVPLTGEEVRDLFRPEAIRIPARGEVALFNNRYFLASLADLRPGTQVRVAFDIHDAGKVWVKDMAGRFIGEAVFGGNTKDGFAKPHIERIREQRVAGMVGRAQDKIETAQAELGRMIEAIPSVELPLDLQIVKDRMEQRREALADAPFLERAEPQEEAMDSAGVDNTPTEAVPVPTDAEPELATPEERYAYSKLMLEIEEELTPDQRRRWANYRGSNEFRYMARREREVEQAGANGPLNPKVPSGADVPTGTQM